MISLEYAISLLQALVASYGSAVLFVTLYFESFGAPLPGETALVASGVLAATGDLPISAVVAAAWLGAVLGDSTGYVIGRAGGRPLLMRFGPSMGLTPERFGRVADQMRRHGFVLVLIARFVVVLRQLNGLVAGVVQMPLQRFVTANALGAALWVGTWGLGPYLFVTWLGPPRLH